MISDNGITESSSLYNDDGSFPNLQQITDSHSKEENDNDDEDWSGGLIEQLSSSPTTSLNISPRGSILSQISQLSYKFKFQFIKHVLESRVSWLSVLQFAVG